MSAERKHQDIDTRIAILAEAVRLAEAMESELHGLSNEVQSYAGSLRKTEAATRPS